MNPLAKQEENIRPQVFLKYSKDDENEKEFNGGKWSETEHNLFLEALHLYGKNWKRITQHVRTRDTNHIRSHAQKFLRKLKNDFHKDQTDIQVADTNQYFEILN